MLSTSGKKRSTPTDFGKTTAKRPSLNSLRPRNEHRRNQIAQEMEEMESEKRALEEQLRVKIEDK
ncbi:hypothetical protein MMC22_000383 [Lobaria immixta]|nr:hypothetical protein [Lobaria immixta]